MNSAGMNVVIQNPSRAQRYGPVVVPWTATAPPPPRLSIIGETGRRLRTQVDRVDPDDPANVHLSLLLDRSVEGGDDDYRRDCKTLAIADDDYVPESGPTVDVGKTTVVLSNDKIAVRVNLTPSTLAGYGSWYAGAVTSVRTKQPNPQELINYYELDLYGIAYDALSDAEIRVMQIDRVRIAHPPWSGPQWTDHYVFDKPYELVGTSSGPVRALVTIKSSPFDLDFRDPGTHAARRLRCRLYRALSLYHGADYVIENVWVRAKEDESGSVGTDLFFTARYFSYLDMGLNPVVTRFSHIPDWLSIGCEWEPFQGYTFATDVHTTALFAPHPEFCGGRKHRAFSWELGCGQRATCLHMFKLGCQPARLADEAGRAWYEHVYKPLRARLVTPDGGAA